MAAPAAVAGPVTPLRTSPNQPGQSGNRGLARSRPHAARFAEELREEGGLGSAFASFLRFRADLLPPEYLDALRSSNETAPPLDSGQQAAAVLSSLGQAGADLLQQREEMLWSTVSRYAFRSSWRGKPMVVQIAREAAPSSAFDTFESRVREICVAGAARAAAPATLAQFREWIRLADDPARERSYLEAAAGLSDRLSAIYPAPVPEISKGSVTCWEWVEGESLEARLSAGDKEAAARLAELILEQICLLSFVDASLDASSIIVSGDRLTVRRANRLAAIPPPLVRTSLRYVSAVLSSNSPVAVRSLLKLAWGNLAIEHESRMLDELSALGPELKGGRRFGPAAAMIESNWRALARSNGSRPLFLDSLHRNLITAAYHNAEVCPGSDCIVDAQWPVVGRMLRMRAGSLLDRQAASEWVVGSGLLFFETMRQANRLADEFRDNEVSIGVDQAPRASDHHREANRSAGVWILIGVFFVMFLISLRWAAVLPQPYSAAGTALAIVSALGLFRTVSKAG